MEDRVAPIHGGGYRRRIADISADEHQPIRHASSTGRKILRQPRIREGVEYAHLAHTGRIQQPSHQRGADEAGATRDEHSHRASPTVNRYVANDEAPATLSRTGASF